MSSSDGNFIQGSFGDVGNFELLVPQGEVIRHWFRNNNEFGAPWHLIKDQELRYPPGTVVKAVRLVQSDFLGDGTHGNFEVIARVLQPQLHLGDGIDFWTLDSRERKWKGPFSLVADGQPIFHVTGDPAFIQSSFGRSFGGRGNFELLVPQDNVIRHWFRDNNASGVPWHLINDQELRYPTSAIVKGVRLVQSNYLGDRTHGNFEVIARVQLPAAHFDHIDFWTLDSKERKWKGPFGVIADGEQINFATGDPGFIQSSFGGQGNFELLVPQGNVIRHWFRNNDEAGVPWHLIKDQELLYPPGAIVKGVCLVQSNFRGDGRNGNFEVTVRVQLPGASDNDHIDFWFLDTRERKWNGPFGLIADGQQVVGATGF